MEALHSVYNTSFTAFTASPLYVREPLTPESLDILAGRLRDTLVGDVVRGIQVSTAAAAAADNGEDGSLGATGPLKQVLMRMHSIAHVCQLDEDDAQTDALVARGQEALCVHIEYQNTTAFAVWLPLLPGRRASSSVRREEWSTTTTTTTTTTDDDPFGDIFPTGQFLELPLLLLHVPAAIRSTVTGFLANTFDCRMSPLHVASDDMITAWERWLRDSFPLQGAAAAKDIALTLAFQLPSETEPPGLRSLEIVIPAEDIQRFVRAADFVDSSTGSTAEVVSGETPFTTALAAYLDTHLALDWNSPLVRVAKIVCGGFAWSADGRVRITLPRRATAPAALRDFCFFLTQKAQTSVE